MSIGATSPSTRWRPRRAGIINLYEYADQAFELAGGRLLLRGHNTSGKTKALELLLPFCLDGDISPAKLDPFASTYKDMKWNLVGCTDQDQRIGYVWLEFERLGDESPRRLTVGIGMRANRSLPNVTRWYFVARDRTVGDDLALLRGREPVTKAELTAVLGEDGEVLDSQRDYRARLNDLLFGFAGEQQYQTMLRLMRDLRRPHLSKTLDPNRVADQLTVGLPEVDAALMRRLAGGLEQLETLERGLARLRDVRERVRRFHQRTYNAYARAVVRERAEALRTAQTAVENAAERSRGVEAQLRIERERAEQASAERDAAEATLEGMTAEEHAVISSSAWSSVAEVEALRERAAAQERAAQALREQADNVAAGAGALEAELIAAQAAAHEQREQATGDLAAAVELAAQAGVARRVELLASQLRDATIGPDSWGSLLRDLAADWRDVLHRHRELLASAQAASTEAEHARAGERDAAARLEQASTRRKESEQELERARSAFDASFHIWRAGLREVQLDAQAVDGALELAHSGRPMAPALLASAESLRSELADERSTLAAARRAATEAAEEAESEIARLTDAREDGPNPPAWSRTDRAERAGAPLWRLIDFNDELDAAARAGLEAALEASGLLDAWVTPSGRLDDPSLADVVLTEAGLDAGGSLADALTTLSDQPVAADVLRRLLRGIGLGERNTGAWVDLDGRFSLGPLAGRGAKSEAQHIGAAAREAHRQARIAALREEIAKLESQIATRDTEIATVETRRATLEAELEALPPLDDVAAALQDLSLASALEAEQVQAHAQAASAARVAADAEIAADEARREHAATHELPPRLDASTLERLKDAAGELTAAAAGVARAWALAEREAQSAQTVAARLAEAQDAASRHDRRARDEAAEARRLLAEHVAREQALGSSGEELRRRHAALASSIKETREKLRHAREDAQQALIAVARLERDADVRGAEHEAARRRREDAGLAFRQLAEAGILHLVLADSAPEDIDSASEWTFTRTLEVSRALPQELLSVRSGAGELAVSVQRDVQLLDRELAEADMGAYASRGQDELLIVHVTEAGGEQTLSQILDTLAAEIADREQILTAEERRVFNDALVEEIADHLRQRMHEVRARVERMNAVLRRSPTAAGKTVELEWRPREDDEGAQRAAVARLRRDVRLLQEQERADLVSFFRARIDAARQEHAAEGQPRPMADTLIDAFDYRSWFAFVLHERSDSNRQRLTRQRHAVGSGGEQSVLIHLPLFAAAAALYEDTSGPRLIMLDEALSGIDEQTRERVLAATVAFDLDVVMTSHELWGTYRSVPQLSIYQLHRENGTPGVHAIPFLWDGEVLHELEQGELLV
jgi:uncharacterized protein (TIGR02680 family)